jgi:leader peptidase (prepilin peptidase)/N-methyltransferase
MRIATSSADAKEPTSVIRLRFPDPAATWRALELPWAWALATILTGLGLWSAVWLLGVQPDLWFATLTMGLAWASAIDLKRLRIPDPITFSLLILGLLRSASMGWQTLIDHTFGVVVGYAALILVALIYRKLRGHDGIGRGDAKLLAAGGAWIGWAGLPYAVAIASATALALALSAIALKRMNAKRPMPFGPFLAVGIWAVAIAAVILETSPTAVAH